MILDTIEMLPQQIHERTGWDLKPEGACKEDRCVPVPDLAITDGKIDNLEFAGRLGMPLAYDDKHALWALAPKAARSGPGQCRLSRPGAARFRR